MTPKEIFLTIKSYEEFDRRRGELRGLKFDREVVEHMSKIFPKPYAGKEELFKSPLGTPGRSIGR